MRGRITPAVVICVGLMTDAALSQTRFDVADRTHSQIGVPIADVGSIITRKSGVPVTRSSHRPASIDMEFERRLLKETHGRGALVEVHTGAAERPTTIFVHGMPDGASTLSPMMQKAIDADETVEAFAYDNKFRSLEYSSRDLASAIETWMDENPAQRLRIDAHSMGGRLALGALAILQKSGRLTGDVELNLIASPIAGVRRAIFARLAPGFLPWIRPLRGIAPGSGFQTVIDRLELPSNVAVHIFVGDKDKVFSHATPKYAALVRKLGATLTVFADATHTSILDEMARLPNLQPASLGGS
jgi:pimeloyl-ACP methyl ester carboxylesterase